MNWAFAFAELSVAPPAVVSVTMVPPKRIRWSVYVWLAVREIDFQSHDQNALPVWSAEVFPVEACVVQVVKLHVVLLHTAVKFPGQSGEEDMVFVPAVESCRKLVPKTNAWANRVHELEEDVALPAQRPGVTFTLPRAMVSQTTVMLWIPVVVMVMGIEMVIFPSCNALLLVFVEHQVELTRLLNPPIPVVLLKNAW